MQRLILILILPLFLILPSCDTLQQIADGMGSDALSQEEVARGLKQALEFGISEGADKLSQTDGYYKSIYKIFLPEEARKVTDKLQSIPGFSNVEDLILEKINRAAEDAATRAKPIFVDAITGMTFGDAMNILLGPNDAATQYLHSATYQNLYNEFQPVILNSLNKFDAVDYWEDAVTAYNKLPFIDKVNPRLDDHVTSRALDGLFDMVEKKEVAIRTDISERTTDLLRKVFRRQDGQGTTG